MHIQKYILQEPFILWLIHISGRGLTLSYFYFKFANVTIISGSPRRLLAFTSSCISPLLLPLLTGWFYQDSLKNCWNVCSVWEIHFRTGYWHPSVQTAAKRLICYLSKSTSLKQRDGFYWLHQKLLTSLLHELCHTNHVSNWLNVSLTDNEI